MRAIALALVAAFPLFASGDERLNGKWTVVAFQSDGVCEIVEDGDSLRFAGGKVIWLRDDPKDIRIPLHGATFDCQFDKSRNPHRLEMSYEQGGKNVWVYCIYDVKDDTLMVRMLFPLILTQDYVTDETRRKFVKDPYPEKFATAKGDATVLGLFRRSNEKPPAKKE